MMIKQIPRKRSKSHTAIIGKLQEALVEARNTQYIAIGLVLVGKDHDIRDFYMVPNTLIASLTCALEDLKDEIRASEYEQD